LGSDVYQPYIVALTAHAFPGDAETCIAAGMDDYVAKPVDRAQLARALDAGARRAAANRDFANGDAGLAGFDGAASGNAASTAAPATAATATVIETETASTPATVAPGDTTADDRDGDFDPSLPDQLLAEFGPEPFSRLVGIFQSEAIRLVGAATTAVAMGDVSQAEKTAHTLKSSAANLGAQGLYESCGRLEALARSGSLDGAELLTARMEGQLTTALRRLDEIVRGVGHP
jgi:HPt (histidine-containing phosphotransfer) domain-containing protein